MLFNRKFIYAFKTDYDGVCHPRIPLGEVMHLAGSLINHGCDASIYMISYGTHAVYRARRPIQKGEHLTDCYITSAANASYKQRQELSNDLYKFSCK